MTATLRQYRLMDGFHIGPDLANPVSDELDELGNPKQRSRTYERGEIIESPTDLTFHNVPGYRPKFEPVAIQGAVLRPGSHAFDPSKETIEEFAERMRGLMVQPGAPAIDDED